jgi:hypothetical protein
MLMRMTPCDFLGISIDTDAAILAALRERPFRNRSAITNGFPTVTCGTTAASVGVIATGSG